MAPVDRQDPNLTTPFLLWFPPGPNAEYFSDRPEDAAWWLASVRGRRCPGARVPCARRPDGAPLPRPGIRTAVTLVSVLGLVVSLFACARWGGEGACPVLPKQRNFYFSCLVVLWWSLLPASLTESCSFGKSKCLRFFYQTHGLCSVFWLVFHF